MRDMVDNGANKDKGRGRGNKSNPDRDKDTERIYDRDDITRIIKMCTQFWFYL